MSKREEFLRRIFCLDFETTSVDASTAEIIEQATVQYVDGNWVIAHEMLHDCRLEKLAPETSACNHIIKAHLEGKPIFSYKDWYPSQHLSNRLLVSHNAPFDLRMIKNYTTDEEHGVLENHWFCTYRMAKKLYVNDVSFSQLNLQYLFYRLELYTDEAVNAHRAGYDSVITGLLLDHLLGEIENRGIIDPSKDYESQLREWLAVPINIERMPIGKHKDKPLAEVPMSYWTWAINNMTRFDPNSDEYDYDFSESVYSLLEDKLDIA
jgi:exodeoxyribonuclease X